MNKAKNKASRHSPVSIRYLLTKKKKIKWKESKKGKKKQKFEILKNFTYQNKISFKQQKQQQQQQQQQNLKRKKEKQNERKETKAQFSLISKYVSSQQLILFANPLGTTGSFGDVAVI